MSVSSFRSPKAITIRDGVPLGKALVKAHHARPALGADAQIITDDDGTPWIAVMAIHSNGDLVGMVLCTDCARELLQVIAGRLREAVGPALPVKLDS